MVKAMVNSEVQFEIETNTGTGKVLVNGKEVNIDLVQTGPKSYHLLKNNHSYNAEVIAADYASKTFTIKVNNRLHTVELKDKYDELMHQLGLDNTKAKKLNNIKAPMPGLVKKIFVTEGQEIKEGDAVVILEAMKMENVLKAAADAVVKTVKVVQGATVEKNEVMILFAD